MVVVSSAEVVHSSVKVLVVHSSVQDTECVVV
jgi:hypothetical protein